MSDIESEDKSLRVYSADPLMTQARSLLTPLRFLSAESAKARSYTLPTFCDSKAMSALIRVCFLPTYHVVLVRLPSLGVYHCLLGAHCLQDTSVDRYINCRKSDIQIELPRTLSGFPRLNVSTSYGQVELPAAESFTFTGVVITTVFADLSYAELRSSTLVLNSTQGNVKLTGASVSVLGLNTVSGNIVASGLKILNRTEAEVINLGIGRVNVSSVSGEIEMGIMTESVVGVITESGSVSITLSNGFHGSYHLKCSNCGLSISGAASTVISEEKRTTGELIGTIGGGGESSLSVQSLSGDVVVRVVDN